jgi:hypothetical protein
MLNYLNTETTLSHLKMFGTALSRMLPEAVTSKHTKMWYSRNVNFMRKNNTRTISSLRRVESALKLYLFAIQSLLHPDGACLLEERPSSSKIYGGYCGGRQWTRCRHTVCILKGIYHAALRQGGISLESSIITEMTNCEATGQKHLLWSTCIHKHICLTLQPPEVL